MLGKALLKKKINENSILWSFYKYMLRTYDRSSSSEPLGFLDQRNSL